MDNLLFYNSEEKTLGYLYQWDINQEIIMESPDISKISEIHFCNKYSKEAQKVAPTTVDVNEGAVPRKSVKIPNNLLQQPETIFAFLCEQYGEGAFRTVHTLIIPVIPKTKPQDYYYTDNIGYVDWIQLSKEAKDFIEQAQAVVGDANRVLDNFKSMTPYQYTFSNTVNTFEYLETLINRENTEQYIHQIRFTGLFNGTYQDMGNDTYVVFADTVNASAILINKRTGEIFSYTKGTEKFVSAHNSIYDRLEFLQNSKLDFVYLTLADSSPGDSELASLSDQGVNCIGFSLSGATHPFFFESYEIVGVPIGNGLKSQTIQYKTLLAGGDSGKRYRRYYTHDGVEPIWTQWELDNASSLMLSHTKDIKEIKTSLEHVVEAQQELQTKILSNTQVDALDRLFEMAVYKDESIREAYNDFVVAFGLDTFRVQREFTIDELFPCGLSYLREANITGAVMSEYGYYTKQGTNRYSYIYFDIPCKYGYTYKFDFETTQSTDNIAIELYNEYALNQVEAEGDYRSADHKEYNWIGNGGEVTPPELINGFAPAGLRFVFNTGTPGVSKITISKKKVV